MSKLSKTEKIVLITIVIVTIILAIFVGCILMRKSKVKNNNKGRNINNIETQSTGLLDLAGNENDKNYYACACYIKMFDEFIENYSSENITKDTRIIKIMAEDEKNSSRFLLQAFVANEDCNEYNVKAYMVYQSNPSKYPGAEKLGDIIVGHYCMAIIDVDCNRMKKLYDEDKIHTDSRMLSEKDLYRSAIRDVKFINYFDVDLATFVNDSYDLDKICQKMNSELKKYDWKGIYYDFEDNQDFIDEFSVNSNQNSNDSLNYAEQDFYSNENITKNENEYIESNYNESINNANSAIKNNEQYVEKSIEVPNLIGLSVSQAEQKLNELGILYDITYVTSFTKDEVFYQSVPAGTVKNKSDTINIKAYKKVNQVSAFANITSTNSSYMNKDIKVIIDGKQCSDMMGNTTFSGSYSAMKFVNNPNITVEIYIDDSLVKSQDFNLDEIANKNNISSNEITFEINI